MNVSPAVRFGAIAVKDYWNASSMYAANTGLRLHLTDKHLDRFKSIADSQGDLEFFVDLEPPVSSLSVSSPNLNRNEPNWWTKNHFKWENRDQVETLEKLLSHLASGQEVDFQDQRSSKTSPATPADLAKSLKSWVSTFQSAFKNDLTAMAIQKLHHELEALKAKEPTAMLDYIFGPKNDLN